MNKVEVVILAGGNMGDTRIILEKALELARKGIGDFQLTSSLFKSDPWGFDSPQHFLNQVWVFQTQLSAASCLQLLLDIERTLGRVREDGAGYSSRVIDLDILYYGDQVIVSDSLLIPHPRIAERKFALMPLAEILPEMVHPILKKTNYSLLLNCTDSGNVQPYDEAG